MVLCIVTNASSTAWGAQQHVMVLGLKRYAAAAQTASTRTRRRCWLRDWVASDAQVRSSNGMQERDGGQVQTSDDALALLFTLLCVRGG